MAKFEYRNYHVYYNIAELQAELRHYLADELGVHSDRINPDDVIFDTIYRIFFGAEAQYSDYSWFDQVTDLLTELRLVHCNAQDIINHIRSKTLRYVEPTIQAFGGRSYIKFWIDGRRLTYSVVEPYERQSPSHSLLAEHA
jgi:hypothetical protein